MISTNEEYIGPFIEKLQNKAGIDWSMIPYLNTRLY
jgi:hypothetical protein